MPSSPLRSPSTSRRWSASVAIVVAVSVVAVGGCGTSEAPRGEPPRTNQPTQPTLPADSTRSTAGPTAPPDTGLQPRFTPDPIAWKPCRPEGYDCATIVVPLDYSHPDGDTIELAVKRHRAAQSGSSRIGSLFYNPGGPGGSGVDLLLSMVDDLPAEVRERFDVVSWDPRGVGDSTPLGCDDSVLDFYLTDLDDLQPPPAVDAAARRVGEDCQAKAGRMLPFVGTMDVARDLDVLREAVGDEKLTFIGVSYGTLIGITYAELFPTHIRALIIDGVLDPTVDPSTLNLDQSIGVENAFNRFIEWCKATSTCPIRDDPAGALDALRQKSESRSLRGSIKGKTIALSPVLALFATTLGTYAEALWPQMAKAVRNALDGDGTLLAALADAYVQEANLGTNNAVNCLDGPIPTAEQLDDLAKKASVQAPRVGVFNANAGKVCEFWPVPAKPLPTTIDATGAPSIQVWGTTGDNVTPYKQAVKVAELLPDARLVTLKANRHAALGQNTCVDQVQAAYLIDLQQPPAGTTC